MGSDSAFGEPTSAPVADLAAAIKAAEEFFAQYDRIALHETGHCLDTKEARLLRTLLAAAREAEGEIERLARLYETQVEYLSKKCLAALARAALAGGGK